MSNGDNSWDVHYSRITFLEKIIASHSNVFSFKRDQDILFTVQRTKPFDKLRILCADEYSFSLGAVQRALLEFRPLHIIYVGGFWNGYTPEAKNYCLVDNIGLYNSKEMSGGLWKRDYWDYYQRDEDGNIVYQYKGA